MIRSTLISLTVCFALSTAGCTRWTPETARPLVSVEPVEVTRSQVTGPLSDLLTKELTQRLVDSGQFIVLNDPDTMLQLGQSRTGRPDWAQQAARIVSGSLYNARHSVHIDVLEMRHARFPRGFPPWRMNELGPDQACVTLHLQVRNLETGRTIISERIQRRRRVADWPQPRTGRVAGSQGFADSTLGKVSAEALDEAVRRLRELMPTEPWTPMVARVDGKKLILNGGSDRGIDVGDRFELFGRAREVRDPQSGQLLGVNVGAPVGVVRVNQVWSRHASCTVPDGWRAERGMVLKPIQEKLAWYESVLD
jgi:hypothetical protein